MSFASLGNLPIDLFVIGRGYHQLIVALKVAGVPGPKPDAAVVCEDYFVQFGQTFYRDDIHPPPPRPIPAGYV